MIVNRSRLVSWGAVFFIAIVSYFNVANAETDSIRDSTEYRQSFQDFYQRLANLPVDILVEELGEQISTALMREGHIARVSLEHRIVEVEREIFSRVKIVSCEVTKATPNNENIENATIAGIQFAITDRKVQANDHARIAAVVAVVVQSTGTNFCRIEGFRQL